VKVEMKAKLLQDLLNKNDIGGFTKIGLLVRIFLYSCVAGVVLLPSHTRPFFCYCYESRCNKQREAQHTIDYLNRVQTAYHVERGEFAPIDKLGIRRKLLPSNYSYHILPNGPVQTSNDPKELAPSFEAVLNIAKPKEPNLTGSIGVVYTSLDKELKQITTRAILCEEAQPSTLVYPRIAPFLPPRSNGEDKCPRGWRDLGR
jgi:hypothetical protein